MITTGHKIKEVQIDSTITIQTKSINMHRFEERERERERELLVGRHIGVCTFCKYNCYVFIYSTYETFLCPTWPVTHTCLIHKITIFYLESGKFRYESCKWERLG